MYNIIFLKTKQGRSTWSLSAFLLPVVFGEQKVPYVIFSHFCFHYFAVVVVESSENKYTWENGWFFFYPAGHWPIFHFCLFFLLRNHSVWKSLKKSHYVQHLFCLRIKHLPHFVVNFSIYAFVNFHQIESIAK